MSSSNRKIGELQKDSHTTTKQQHRGHWRSISRPRQEATEESHPRTQLDRRNMVQSEKGNTPSRQHTTTTSTSTSQRANTSNISTTYSRWTTSTNVWTQREEASHWGDQQVKQWPQHRHTKQQYNIQKKSVQHRTIGPKKVHTGNVRMSNQEGTCTVHNKQMMDQTWQSWQHGDKRWWSQQVATEDTELTMTGQQRGKQHST